MSDERDGSAVTAAVAQPTTMGGGLTEDAVQDVADQGSEAAAVDSAAQAPPLPFLARAPCNAPPHVSVI